MTFVGGYLPPLLLRNDREIQFLEGGGLVLGAMEDSIYETERCLLQPGESLFMCTDGITEAMNQQGEPFSEDRLNKEIIALYGNSIKEMIKTVLDRVNGFAHGTPQSDDITLMIIQFKGKKGLGLT